MRMRAVVHGNQAHLRNDRKPYELIIFTTNHESVSCRLVCHIADNLRLFLGCLVMQREVRPLQIFLRIV